MYNLKGFYSYPTLISNVPDVVAKLGEISSNSLTYAKDKTYHSSNVAPNTNFISFHSVEDDTVKDVNSNVKDIVLKLGEFLYQQEVQNTINSDAGVVRQLVSAEFNGVITDFNTGVMVTNQNIWLPEWIEFTIISDTVNRVNIWLSDESFGAQYDEYIIEVIHPIIPYDDFFKDPLLVKQLLDNYSLVEKLEEVQEKRDQYPYTYQRAFEFDYVNPIDKTLRYPAKWIVLIYGINGNNPDKINGKIVEELLGDSTRNREDWEGILPDLFLNTEFIFTPFWKNYSVEASDFRAGIYSPVINPRKALSAVKICTQGPNYTPAYLTNNYELGSNMYKSIAFAVVGNPKNRLGLTMFSDRFSDYFLVTNDSADINRAEPETVEWLLLFGRLLKAAENMTRYSSVPKGISRMIRSGVIYASIFHKNINYMVVSKSSVEDLT